MQSTGHTSTQAVSFVPMQGSAMMYIPIGSSSSVQRDGGDSSTTVASAPRGACALVGAPARGSLGCELDREPGPVLAPAPRGARRPPLVTAGASRAADGGWVPSYGPRRALAARPSLANWIRKTTRAAGAGAELQDQGCGRARIRASRGPVRRKAQILKRSGGDGYPLPWLVPVRGATKFRGLDPEIHSRPTRRSADLGSGLRSSPHPGEPRSG